MDNYQDLQGNKVEKDNPNRAVWYGACCTFWTDNWNKLSQTEPISLKVNLKVHQNQEEVEIIEHSGIPCCPHCKKPGMMTDYTSFMQGATKFEVDGNYGYRHYVRNCFESCSKKQWEDVADRYAKGPRHG